jgi:alkylated DNA repair dioxygenase AlkB
MNHQPSLFDLPLAPRKALPDGFRYQAELVTADEELDLAARFATLALKPYEHLGYLGNRRVAAFGWRRDEDGAMVETSEGVPDFLQPLLGKVAAFTGLPVASFRHALVTEYAPGAGIGWHRDRPPAVAIAGVSLLSPCAFRLRRRAGQSWDRASITAEPRSAYLMSGPARSAWQHSIPPVETLRYSVTFRTVAGS